MRIPKFYLALLAFFALCHLNSHAALQTVAFDLTAAFSSGDMSGYYANGQPLSIDANGLITGGPFSSAGIFKTLSKKVVIDGRTYNVVIELNYTNTSKNIFSINRNLYGRIANICMKFGTNVEFDIYVENDQKNKAGKITQIRFYHSGHDSSYPDGQYDRLLKAENQTGTFVNVGSNPPQYKHWYLNSGTDIVKFVTGPTYVTYTDYTTKLREIDVVFEPIVTNPYPPVVEFLDGLSPDEDNNVYFINTTDIRMGLDPGDTGLSMDLYCYEPEKGASSANPPVDAAYKVDHNSEKTVSDSKALWIYAVNSTNPDFVSEVKEYNFNKLTALEFESVSALTGIERGKDVPVSNDAAERQIVTFTKPILVEAVYPTNQNTTFIYLKDTNGDMIRAVCSGQIPDYTPGQTIQPRGIAGRYLHNAGTPEIDITEYVRYCVPSREADPAVEFPATDERDNDFLAAGSPIVSKADFNRHIILKHVTAASANHVVDANGNSYQLYPRFKDFDVPATTEGSLLYVDCYVGKDADGIILIPTEIYTCADRPYVKFTKGNRISGDVHLVKVDATHPIEWKWLTDASRFKIYATVNGGDPIDTPQPITPDMFKGTVPLGPDAGKPYCDLVVTAYIDDAAREIKTSTSERIRFIKEEGIEVMQISDIKGSLLDKDGNIDPDKVPDTYYLVSGQVVIEAKTDYYLYVRDNKENASSKSHLLIYNPNKWDSPQILAEDENGTLTSRSLEAGDVITGFVIKPDVTPQGNLRGNAQGFARTFSLAGNVTEVQPSTLNTVLVQYEDEENESYYTKLLYGPSHRMMHYRFENVTVNNRPNPAYDTATELEDGTRVDKNGDIVDKLIYTLELGTKLDMRFNVFTSSRGGWVTSYAPGTQYTIEGVIVHDSRSESGYSIAMMDFTTANHALAPAKIFIEGLEDAEPNSNGEVEYIHNGKIIITKAEGASEDAVIYYTLDGTDPKTNRHRGAYNEATGIVIPDDYPLATVRAYAAWPGAAPSDEVTAKFRRTSVDVNYILNFISQAQEGVPYRFAGNARIVAVGGNYMFLRGSQGHYLSVLRDYTDGIASHSDAWAGYEPGQYLSDFILTVDKVGEQKIVRGGRVNDSLMQFMPQGSDNRPESLQDDIEITHTLISDKVSEVTVANARRLVTVQNVALEGVEFEEEAENHATEWTLIPNQGHDTGKAVRVNHTVLEYSMPEKGTQGSYYNVTGFVMLDENGDPELWPTAVERIENAPAPTVACDDANSTLSLVSVNTYTLEFYPATTVSLAYTGKNANHATIYYIFTPDENAPAADARWNVYGQPFAVTATGYLHVYAEVPGMEPSGHTHIELVRMAPSGDVDFKVKAVPSGSEVTLSPVADLDKNTYRIFYSLDGTEPSVEFTEPFLIKETTTVLARLEETGKSPGAVNRAVITAGSGYVDPADVSGKVTYRSVKNDLGETLVELMPLDDLAEGSYEIYYTTDAGVVPVVSDNMLYTAPFPVPQSGIVLAILVENNKLSGDVCALNVWFIPSAIDGIDADGSDACSVTAEQGDIIVSAPAAAVAEVYSVNGALVRSTADRRIGGLARGVYIVRVAGKTFKIKL